MDGLDGILVGATGLLGAANVVAGLAGTRMPRSLKALREAHRHGLASMLPYRRLVADNVVQLGNGALFTAFDVNAPSVEALTARGLIDSDTDLARTHNMLDSRMVVHFRQRFTPVREYDRPDLYPDPYLQFLDERRAEYFLAGSTFRSVNRIGIAWIPPNAAEIATANLFTARAEGVKADDSSLASRLATFNAVCESYINSLALNASVRRLGLRPWVDRYGNKRCENELLSHLATALAGVERRVEHPGIGAFVNGLIALPFRGGYDVAIGNVETQVVIIKELPMRTREAVLASLKPLGIPYELIVRWLPHEPTQAAADMRKSFEMWQSKTTESRVPDPTHLRMMEEASAALSLITDAGLRFGDGAVWALVRHHDVAVARKGAEKLATTLSNIGYPSHVASLTAESEFLGTLDGDGYHGVRKFPLHSLNVANIFSLHGDSTGRRYAEHPTLAEHTPALVYARSRAGTIVRVHLNHTPRDVAMWCATGGMGRGKSMTSNILGVGWLARGGNTGWTVMEKGGSSYRLNRWLNGAFLRPGVAGMPGIALFYDLEEDEDVTAVLGILTSMLELQGVEVTPPRGEALANAMELIRGMERRLRDLSAFIELLQDSTGVLRDALRRYSANGGVIGTALDTNKDEISVARITTVELTTVLSFEPKYRIPVLGAILWKLRRSVRIMRAKQKRSDLHWGFTIDEAHALLELEQGCRFIAEMYREARKEQLWLGLLTQSITHYTKSPIAADIKTACGRKFWFRNASLRDAKPDSDEKSVADYYREMGCPERGIEEIPGLVGFEVGISDEDTGTFDVVTWEPDKVTLAILGRSRGAFNTPSDNSVVDDYMRKHPKTWREELLRTEGVDARTIRQMTEIVNHWQDQQEAMFG